jgi:hypothetical protein
MFRALLAHSQEVLHKLKQTNAWSQQKQSSPYSINDHHEDVLGWILNPKVLKLHSNPGAAN